MYKIILFKTTQLEKISLSILYTNILFVWPLKYINIDKKKKKSPNL